MEENEIFKYLNPKENQSLLQMQGRELQDLIYYLNNFYLTLRDTLNFSRKTTFGMEIEFEEAKKQEITNALVKDNLNEKWFIKDDGSLSNGGEIATPVFHDEPKTWHDLARVCSILRNNSSIVEYAGGHIHVGTPVLGSNKNSWLNFIKIWSIYENIIFRFSYGEYLTPRREIKDYALPMKKDFNKVYDELKEKSDFSAYSVVRELNFRKHQAVNFQHVSHFDQFHMKNTIEFRCPNGTLDPVIWQNNLNLFVKLLKYARSDKFNNDILDERKKFNDSIFADYDHYNNIFLTQALEFADLIFDNNLDKIYFLRQYLKNYEIGNLPLEKAKLFTKTLI